MARWQVQEAKMRLSQVIEEAQSKGPQMITRHGVDRAVVLSVDDFRSLSAHKPDLREYLLGGPKVDDFEIAPDSYNNLQAMLDVVREKYGLDFLILEPGFKLKRFDDY